MEAFKRVKDFDPMTSRLTSKLAAAAATTLCGLAIASAPAAAGQLHGDWNYGIDAFKDGSGGSHFDIKGMAIKDAGDRVFVALTGGTPLGGVYNSGAADRNIGWGDLFFNFSDKTFKQANAAGELFAVRFAGTNDSGAASTGVYSGVTAKSVTGTNHGYKHLKQYYNYGWGKANTQGTDIATRQAAYDYYGRYDAIRNVIGSGTKVGDIESLNLDSLVAEGLDFGNFGANGTHTIGFAFNKSMMAAGSYMANVFLECGNDAVALGGELEDSVSTPEPASLLGFLALGAIGTAALKRRETADA